MCIKSVKHDAHVKKYKQRKHSLAWYHRNKDKAQSAQAAYRVANRESISDRMKVYAKKYREANPEYALVRHTLERIHGKASKVKKAEASALVGYTGSELRSHLEALFQPDMSWENHGEWHIDHIKPIRVFVAEGITDPAIINALSNLQPLWAYDNLAKGGRYSD